MATLDFTVTGTPADIVAALSLREAQRVEIANTHNRLSVFIREAGASAQPDATARARQLFPGQSRKYQTATGMALWCWSRTGEPVAVVVDEIFE